MKKVRRLILMLSVVITVLIGATAIASAAEYTAEVGNSTVTVKTDRNVSNLVFDEDGTEVTYTVTSDNLDIEYILVNGSSVQIPDAKTTTYTHKYSGIGTYTFEVVLENGEKMTLNNCPTIGPKSFPASEISLKTDPKGIVVQAYGYKLTNGEEYLIEVFKSKNRDREKDLLAQYTAKTEGGPVSILKKNAKWYKANTKYYLTIYPMATVEINGKETTIFGKGTNKTVQTSPTTQPVIKSLKVSNVKVKKYFDTERWKYRYKTTYKLTITLSRKPSNAKGLMIKVGAGEYQVKGTGKTFTTTVVHDSGVSYKGSKEKVKVMTYSTGSAYGYALSSQSKTRTVTVKAGTY